MGVDTASADQEDHALVMQVRSGRREVLEDLVRSHRPRIYNIAVRMLHHPEHMRSESV